MQLKIDKVRDDVDRITVHVKNIKDLAEEVQSVRYTFELWCYYYLFNIELFIFKLKLGICRRCRQTHRTSSASDNSILGEPYARFVDLGRSQRRRLVATVAQEARSRGKS